MLPSVLESWSLYLFEIPTCCLSVAEMGKINNIVGSKMSSKPFVYLDSALCSQMGARFYKILKTHKKANWESSKLEWPGKREDIFLQYS